MSEEAKLELGMLYKKKSVKCQFFFSNQLNN
jgi:hypothetical protein